MNTWQNIYFKFKIVTHITFALGEETTGGNMSGWKNAGREYVRVEKRREEVYPGRNLSVSPI